MSNDNDDLITDIEAFLADGGEQADADTLLAELNRHTGDPNALRDWHARLTSQEQRVLLDRATTAFRGLQEIFDAVIAAIMDFAKAVMEAFTPFFEKCIAVSEAIMNGLVEHRRAYVERCQRAAFAHQLRRWRIPTFAAVWIASIWPQRWLPVLATPPPFLLY